MLMKNSEFLLGIEPATLSLRIRCFTHWAAKTRIGRESQGIYRIMHIAIYDYRIYRTSRCMRDVCPAGIDKNLTSDSASHVSLCNSVGRESDWLVEGCALIRIPSLTENVYLSIQLEKHILSNFIIKLQTSIENVIYGVTLCYLWCYVML